MTAGTRSVRVSDPVSASLGFERRQSRRHPGDDLPVVRLFLRYVLLSHNLALKSTSSPIAGVGSKKEELGREVLVPHETPGLDDLAEDFRGGVDADIRRPRINPCQANPTTRWSVRQAAPIARLHEDLQHWLQGSTPP